MCARPPVRRPYAARALAQGLRRAQRLEDVQDEGPEEGDQIVQREYAEPWEEMHA